MQLETEILIYHKNRLQPVVLHEPYSAFLQWNHHRPLAIVLLCSLPQSCGTTYPRTQGQPQVYHVLKLNWKRFYFPKFFMTRFLIFTWIYLYNWLYPWRDDIRVLKNVLRISKIPHRHSKPFMRFKDTCILIHRILISWSWLSTYSGVWHIDLILSQRRFLGILSSIHNFRTVI